MSDYTPTTEEVRDKFSFLYPKFAGQFDRWLAEVKKQAWEQGWNSCSDSHWHKTENHYRQGASHDCE